MLEIFGDFGFVGGSDPTPARYQDVQRCINLYPEIAGDPARAKVAVALLGAPGLIELCHVEGGGAPGYDPAMTAWPHPYSGTQYPVRGLWVLPGRTEAVAVIGNTCYVVTGTPGSFASPGALTLTEVGTLLTSAGPVVIRDNGSQGDHAVIVDGPNGYLLRISTRAFSQITDEAFLGATHVAYIDGWWVFNRPNSPIFYTIAAPYSTGFDGSLFALKDAFSDKLVALIESKEQLWLIGEQASEIWYNAGGQYFPFQRLVGTMLQVGCEAPYSVARLSAGGQDGLIWLGRSERGECAVIRVESLSARTVSTPAVSHALSTYATRSDAIGYVYLEDGHDFYMLTFPGADKTWVYDASMPPEFAWTERASYDPYAQQLHRHRGNCCMNFGGMRIVGDYQTGSLHQMTRAAYTDAGWPLLAVRRAPLVWDKDSRQRVFVSSLQLDIAPGGAPSAGPFADPQAMLRTSRDGGTTFGQPVVAPIGRTGEYTNRCIWRRLGWSRGVVPEVSVIAPCSRDIMGATLEAST